MYDLSPKLMRWAKKTANSYAGGPPVAPSPVIPPQRVAAAGDVDNDGVPDANDKCPNQAETRNGYADGDGCPDELPHAIAGIVGRLQVEFRSGSAELLPVSYPELTRVVTVLKGYPDVRIEIEGHTDNRGDAGVNTALSQARAESVTGWLARQGLDSIRLVAKGYGPTRPLAPNDIESNRARNRRIELRLVH